ncbi:hypothetical protein [Mucilaginibacter ginsenosidivorans]|uniref:Uncharacterized protein n=1 Tax=Mucilaginibacter ginsenosidivorans TaxID=398053 RepID=A0A5B8V3D7_9SPHI|nr:hypothetical protein [Mucilaginibacter ginsenosidivorans]QEC65211.1 hypothetical protein FRZ54_22430 [Mucilaginibacter ginsenosidivorans]
MFKSLLSKAPKFVILLAIIPVLAFKYHGKPKMDEQEWLQWSNKCLHECYDPSGEAKLKNWELTISSEHFLRLRKTFQHGKQEYFSLHLHLFNDLDYFGDISHGTLELKADKDDIIVQTYDDPKGNVDSMATALDLPVKNMEPERLDSLRSALLFFKTGGL